jgi:DNA mismatch repair protein
MINTKYDSASPRSIEAYGQLLIGKTFLDVINESDISEFKRAEITDAYGNVKRKGGLGTLLEEIYFGYKANSNQQADFHEAGVELKVSPYNTLLNGEYRAGERLVITMISYDGEIELDFDLSHVWDKIRLILLVYYFRNRTLTNNLLYQIDFVKLFSPPPEDLEIIKNDYKKIVDKIRLGLAHELSESDTIYLGACTKGTTAKKSTVKQFYGAHIPARKRAFCLKNSYMNYVLNSFIIGDVDTYEKIIKDSSELKEIPFEEIVLQRVNRHKGKTDKELCSEFKREYNNNKAQWIDLSYKMLGIKSSRAAEFEKANIVVKAIRINENGGIRESMSFPAFKFKELANEKWEDSTVYDYFCETKFLFVVYNKCGDEYKLKGCKLWNMPNVDLDNIVQKGWQDIKNVILNGVSFTKKKAKRGTEISNNLPNKSNNEIIHIRPHARKSAYRFSNGEVIGNIQRDANELPDGQWMTTQSFWINNSYILRQIEDVILD